MALNRTLKNGQNSQRNKNKEHLAIPSGFRIQYPSSQNVGPLSPHTHMQAHTRTLHAHVCTCARTCVHMRAQVHAHMHSCTHAHAHTCTHKYTGLLLAIASVAARLLLDNGTSLRTYHLQGVSSTPDSTTDFTARMFFFQSHTQMPLTPSAFFAGCSLTGLQTVNVGRLAAVCPGPGHRQRLQGQKSGPRWLLRQVPESGRRLTASLLSGSLAALTPVLPAASDWGQVFLSLVHSSPPPPTPSGTIFLTASQRAAPLPVYEGGLEAVRDGHPQAPWLHGAWAMPIWCQTGKLHISIHWSLALWL